jgi:hypothetical protein
VNSLTDKVTNIWFSAASDRVSIFVNGEFTGIYGVAGDGATIIPVKVYLKKGNNELLFLADNLGRFCVGQKLGELKGIFGPVYLDNETVDVTWQISQTDKFKVNIDKGYYDYWCFKQDEPLEKAEDLASSTWLKSFGKTWSAKTDVVVKSGQTVYLDYRNFDDNLSVWVNGKQAFFTFRRFLASGFNRFNLGRYLKPGINKIELCYAAENPGGLLKNVMLVKCTDSYLLKGDWCFQSCTEKPGKQTVVESVVRFPAFWKTKFKLGKITRPIMLRVAGSGKGQIYLNGHNIGRYWHIGPQTDYYLPEPWLKTDNELVLFEETGQKPLTVKLV